MISLWWGSCLFDSVAKKRTSERVFYSPRARISDPFQNVHPSLRTPNSSPLPKEEAQVKPTEPSEDDSIQGNHLPTRLFYVFRLRKKCWIRSKAFGRSGGKLFRFGHFWTLSLGPLGFIPSFCVARVRVSANTFLKVRFRCVHPNPSFSLRPSLSVIVSGKILNCR